MAEEKLDGREMTWRQLLPWTELFRGFQIALDLNKLLLAAAGILAMFVGWWLLSKIFTAHLDAPPTWPSSYKRDYDDLNAAWAAFKADRDHWNLMYETADLSGEHSRRYEVEDLAATLDEYNLVKEALTDKGPREVPDVIDRLVRDNKLSEQQGRLYIRSLDRMKPAARLASPPWNENRGPNPYLLLTGQAGIPWEPGHFWDWFLRDQLLVMLEPLVKMVLPLVYFFNARADFTSSLYFLLVMLWTLLVWSVVGGAITRIAAVQVARGEKIGLREALSFTVKRFLSYLLAPLCPLIGMFVLLVVMILFGIVHMIPFFGDIFVDGLFWPVMVLFGLGMALLLVGLVGWPLMSCTISAEGTDSWEAVTRSYSYIYQRPWHYLWYSLVAIAYGSLLVFFIGFMGSLTVYLAKWGVSKGSFTQQRDPSFLFVHAPQSFGWRTLLLEGATSTSERSGPRIVENGQINPQNYNEYVDSFKWYNRVGAWLVALWLGLVFLLVLGFGYSYFWSASTIIYLLMRRNLDSAELDEVYLEEDEQEGAFGTGMPPAPMAPAVHKPATTGPTMVEPPTLKARTPSASSTTPSALSPPPAAPLPASGGPAKITPAVAAPAPAPAPMAPAAPPPPAPPPPAPLPPEPLPPASGPPALESPAHTEPHPGAVGHPGALETSAPAEKSVASEPLTPPPLLPEPPRPPEEEKPPHKPDEPL